MQRVYNLDLTVWVIFKLYRVRVLKYLLMYLPILLFPFLGFLSTNLLGRFIGINGAKLLATLSIFLSFVLSCLAFYESALCGSVCTFFLLP